MDLSFLAILAVSALAAAALLAVVVQRLAGRIKALEAEMASLRIEQAAAAPAARASGPAPAPMTHDRPAADAPDRTFASLFERVVGGRLLIWIGGIALAAGGIFLIRQSIELITPEARMIAAALLGIGLIGAGEYARAGRLFSDDLRIGQALVGAGLAVLYSTAYGSHFLFGLIGSGTALVLMVAITVAALALSLRHGMPTAALGLVGGLLTPALVGDRQAGALPVLLYLALLDVALFAIAWRRGWDWLAAAAIAGSFAWTGWFILGSARDALPSGLFAAALGLAASLLALRGRSAGLLAPALLVALLELAVLVGRGDIGPPAWALFGAVAGVGLWVSGRRGELDLVAPAALLIGLCLLAVQAAGGSDPLLPWAAAAMTLLFAGACALAAARGGPTAALTACGALAGPLLIVRALRPELLVPAGWGMLAWALALAALGLLLLIRRGGSRSGVGEIGAGGVAAVLLGLGASDLVSGDFLSAAWLVLATALLLAGMRLKDRGLRVAGLAFLTVTVCKVFLVDASALGGVLRILSFLGLGVALIGIGLLYGRVLGRAPSASPGQ